MTERELLSPRSRRPFQFTLRTLLLLFIVLGSSLAVFGTWGVLVFIVAVALGVYLHEPGSYYARLFLRLAVACALCALCVLGLCAIDAATMAGHRAVCLNNMKRLGLALQNYHSTNGCFPPAYTTDKSGKPLHSWRTLILPYMEYGYLYKQVDLNQPWNSPKNKKILTTQLREFICPSDPSSSVPGTTQTNYFAIQGPNTAWAGDKPRKISDFGKYASTTIMLVDVPGSGIDWAVPRDISLDALTDDNGHPPALAASNSHGHDENFFFTSERPVGACVAMADGSVQHLPPGALTSENLPKLLQIGGCNRENFNYENNPFGEVVRLKWPNIAALAVWLLSVGTLLIQAVRSRKMSAP